MVDFQVWDATTHPIWRLENDLNNVLAHGIRKGYGCIVWKNGAVYEATNRATGLIVYGGADNVGAVDGTDFSAVCDAVVDAGSYKYLYIASNASTITWLRDNIPIDCIVEGDIAQYVVIKEQDDEDANYVTLSPESMVMNVAIWDKGGVDIGMGTNGPRQVRFHANMRKVATVNISSWENQFCVVDTGEAATDNPGIGVNQFGIGDAYWAGVQGNGTGYRVDVNDGVPAGTGTGVYIPYYGAGKAMHIVPKAGSTGYAILITQEADVPGLYVVATVDTASDIVVTSPAKTAGQMINLFHSTSTFTGNGINMDFANTTGTFNGKFINCANDSLDRFAVDDTGQIYVARAGVGDTLDIRIDGDTNPRIAFSTSTLSFGPGNAGVDANLYRGGASLLKSDSTFEATVINSINRYEVNDTQVVGAQGAVIADVGAGGGDSDGTCRAKVDVILAMLRSHGLIDT